MNQSKYTYSKAAFAIAVLLTAAILLPTSVKFAHIFEDHKHELCEDFNTVHIHDLDLDCEFYKFKLNTQFYSLERPIDLATNTEIREKDENFQVTFIKSNVVYLSLRAPPPA